MAAETRLRTAAIAFSSIFLIISPHHQRRDGVSAITTIRTRALALVCLLSVGGPASAEPYTWTGTLLHEVELTVSGAPIGPFPEADQVFADGTPVTITFDFDPMGTLLASDQPGANIISTFSGSLFSVYAAADNFQGDVDGNLFAAEVGQVTVMDDAGVGPSDGVFVGTDILVGGSNITGFQINGHPLVIITMFDVYEPNTLSDQSLPSQLPDLPALNLWFFTNGLGGRILQFNGQLMPSTTTLVTNLMDAVTNITGAPAGLQNKLEPVADALGDENTNNDDAAINKLKAFCRSVEAQRSKSLSDDQADALIEGANDVISSTGTDATGC